MNMPTSNIAIQTFLELQQVKTLLDHSRITIWQSNTRYEINKPIRFNNKLFVTKIGHTSGTNFDPTKFEALEASTVPVENIPLEIEGFQSGNLKDALQELFQLANNGKSLIATAVVGKGGVASPSDSFALLSQSIDNLVGGGAKNKLTKLNVAEGGSITLDLAVLNDITDLSASVYEYTQSPAWVHYDCPFDNGDADDFLFNSSYVYFDGKMKLKDEYEKALVKISKIGAAKIYESSLQKNLYNEIHALSYIEEEIEEVIEPVGVEFEDGFLYEVELSDALSII
jgi:hypothetical protein